MHKGKSLRIWIEDWLYDNCRELVIRGAYRSMSELVRDGMEMALAKNEGYEETFNMELANKYSEDETISIRIKIDGTIMGLTINARWLATTGQTQLPALIDDLHIPQPISAIEEKYGTTIVLYNVPPTGKQASRISGYEAYKETNAYKMEHGLPLDE